MIQKRVLGMAMLVLASMVLALLPRATAADDAFDSMLRHDFEFAARQSTATTGKISTTS